MKSETNTELNENLVLAYIFGQERRLLVLASEKINWDKLKIQVLLMEACQHARGACGHGCSIQLKHH
jgi:hypothetical protein